MSEAITKPITASVPESILTFHLRGFSPLRFPPNDKGIERFGSSVPLPVARKTTNFIEIPRPRFRKPVPAKTPAIWIELPPPRRKISEAEGIAAWDALPEAVSRSLPKDLHQDVLTPHAAYARAHMPVRIIRRVDYTPPRHRRVVTQSTLPETDEDWVTLWPADMARLGAPRP